MKFAMISIDGNNGLAVCDTMGQTRAIMHDDPNFPGDLDSLVTAGGGALEAAGQLLSEAPVIADGSYKFLPPIQKPEKFICVGLNYSDHAAEGGFDIPEHPTIFTRFVSSLIGHQQPLLVPPESEKFDYEGELVVILGKGGRRISKASALEHVVGYSIFNDASVRDFQLRTPQWTVGKNFDDTGAFGPWLVTADEVPSGGAGLKIETRLNDELVQSSNTSMLIFDVATLISELSIAMTLKAGDVIITGTPSGVGAVRDPQLWMKPGDICEVEIEGLGVLSNPVKAE